MRTHLFLLPLAVGAPIALTAQSLVPEVFSSGGGYHQVADLSLEWTLGQLATQTLGVPGGLLTEGFHQPLLQIIPPDAANRDGKLLPTIVVYPNPVQNRLNISITGEGHESYSELQLLDVGGRILAERRNTTYQSTQHLDLDQLPAGTYHLRIAQPSGELTQTFTVIKLN